MNQEQQMNAMLTNPIFQALFLNNLLYQPQLFQYMIHQNQCVKETEIKQEELENQSEKRIELQNEQQSWLTKIVKQTQNHTDNDQMTHAKGCSDDDESSPRVNGHWSKQEHKMYLQFVDDHEDILKSKYDKKSKKIFKLMSQYIPTRTATQCRSHHQKFNPLQKNKKKRRAVCKPIPYIIQQEN